MFATRKALLFFWILNPFLFVAACAPLKPTRVAAVAYTVEDVAAAAAKQPDPSVIRDGMPAYLMLVDGLIESYPDNQKLLFAGCQAYTSYASSFLEDTDPHQANVLYRKALAYGFRALSPQGKFERARSGTLDEFNDLLRQYGKKEVPALFCTTSSWASWISLNPDDLEALADLPMLESTMHRVLELDDTFYYGAPHLFMATYLAAKPAVLGGNLDKARAHFDQAFAIGKGKFLMAKVLFAQYYAVRLRDRTLFEETLEEVIAAPVDEVPELTLTNVLAQEKAKKLLEKVDDYFGELP